MNQLYCNFSIALCQIINYKTRLKTHIDVILQCKQNLQLKRFSAAKALELILVETDSEDEVCKDIIVHDLIFDTNKNGKRYTAVIANTTAAIIKK